MRDGQFATNYERKLSDENGKLRAERDALLKACKRLLVFNEELCQDIGVSTHYPSAEFARSVIDKAERESDAAKGTQ